MIALYLSLQIAEKEVVLAQIVGGKFQEKYTAGFRSDIIIESLAESFNKSKSWIRQHIAVYNSVIKVE